MKWIYCVLLLVYPYMSRAQDDGSQIKALGIGDKVPQLKMGNVYNNPGKTIQWKPAKNKITILHFLATYCSSCIAFTPQWHALQERFGDSLQVILVSDEVQARLDRFIQKRPGYFGNIPVLFNNRSLKQLFPFEFISHLVWINGEGRVAAITGTAYATAKNISTVLQGDMPGWPVKRDISNFNKAKPLLRINDNNIPYSSLPARSMHSSFSSHMPDLPRGWNESTDSAAGQVKISIINLPLEDVFRKLLNARALPPTQVLAPGTDPDHFFMDTARHLKAGWELQHTYCMEWLLPMGMSKEKRQVKMLADISFYQHDYAA
ncbi:MAG: redoxin domain-containing protein, partial [Flavobacterium sp.]